MSLGLATRQDSNWPAQLQKLARVLKFWICQEQIYVILSRQRIAKAQITLRRVQADLHLCCSHIAKTSFVMSWLR